MADPGNRLEVPIVGRRSAVEITRQLMTLRDQIAPEASPEEIAYFGAVCARLGLSPFADQITLIGRMDRRVGRKVHRHQITVAGRRALASRTGELVGIEGPEWCGPRKPGPVVLDSSGYPRVDASGDPIREPGALEWLDVWDRDDGPPYCARVFVWRAGWIKPANGTVKWSEFVQTGNDGKLVGLWRTHPSHMLGKCAESLALRRAFPDVITDEIIGGFDAGDLADVLDVAPSTSPGPDADAALSARAGPGPSTDDDDDRASAREILSLEGRIGRLDDWTRDKLREWWTSEPALPNYRLLDREQVAAVIEWLDDPPRATDVLERTEVDDMSEEQLAEILEDLEDPGNEEEAI